MTRLWAASACVSYDVAAPPQAVRQHVDKATTQLKSMASGKAELQATIQRSAEIWERHEDSGKVRPMGIAVLILAHKWDEFEAAFPESDYKKLACKALRYYAHLNGASLACAQHKDKQVRAVATRSSTGHPHHSARHHQSRTHAAAALHIPQSCNGSKGTAPPAGVTGRDDERAWLLIALCRAAGLLPARADRR